MNLRLLITLASLFGWIGVAGAETREFIVYIDGQPAGQYQLSIEQNRDGTMVVNSSAQVRVLLGHLPIYRYAYRGVEMWKDNKLQRLDSFTDENGRQFQVLAVAGADQLRVGVNGHEHAAPAQAWTTSYWFLPGNEMRRGDMALLDCDTGRVLKGRLGFVGAEQMRIAGRLVPCRHFKLTGAANIDLWYDGKGRLIHQESSDNGHKTSLQINNIRP